MHTTTKHMLHNDVDFFLLLLNLYKGAVQLRSSLFKCSKVQNYNLSVRTKMTCFTEEIRC